MYVLVFDAISWQPHKYSIGVYSLCVWKHELFILAIILIIFPIHWRWLEQVCIKYLIILKERKDVKTFSPSSITVSFASCRESCITSLSHEVFLVLVSVNNSKSTENRWLLVYQSLVVMTQEAIDYQYDDITNS